MTQNGNLPYRIDFMLLEDNDDVETFFKTLEERMQDGGKVTFMTYPPQEPPADSSEALRQLAADYVNDRHEPEGVIRNRIRVTPTGAAAGGFGPNLVVSLNLPMLSHACTWDIVNIQERDEDDQAYWAEMREAEPRL